MEQVTRGARIKRTLNRADRALRYRVARERKTAMGETAVATKRVLYGVLIVVVAVVAVAQTYGPAKAGPSGASGSETMTRSQGATSLATPRFMPALATPYGSSGAATSASPALADDQQFVQDTGFEDGTSTVHWSQASSGGFQRIDMLHPHTGSWNADLCGYAGCNPDVLVQSFTVPSGVYASTLTFWAAAYCPADATSSCSSANNAVDVSLIDPSNNFIGETVSGSGPAGAISTYQAFSLDAGSFLASRGGETIELEIFSSNQSGDFGGFYLDDITVTANDPATNVTASSSTPGGVSVSWNPPPDAVDNDVTGYQVQLFGANRSVVQTHTATVSPFAFTGLANGVPYYAVVSWVNPTLTGPPSAQSFSVTPFSGVASAPGMTAVSTQQYFLPNSDGSTWQRVDETNLSFEITPGATESVLLSANADLWTFNASYNQDIGIMVTPGAGAPVIAAWKESGGFAGTFSPNAAFVQTVYPMSSGTTYRVDLVWKSNKSAIGASIAAGAGPISTAFSPTRLDARVLPAGFQSAESNTQYQFSNSDGSTWVAVDTTNLQFSFTPSATASYVLSGNADMWTFNAGYNQDLAINVSPACNGQSSTIAAWKESGGFAGTFSPNAAFVQTVCPMNMGTHYTVTLEFKTNKPASGVTIAIGAGPNTAPFSPTSLTAYPLPASAGIESWDTEASTAQYQLANNDGATWAGMDAAHLMSTALNPGGAETVLVSVNSDLWTSTAGYNQDIGVFVSVDGGTATLLAWKESGGFGGTFSPNAAFLESEYTMATGHTYTFTVAWKANIRASGATIWAGAGPIGGMYSPTRLTVVPVS